MMSDFSEDILIESDSTDSRMALLLTVVSVTTMPRNESHPDGVVYINLIQRQDTRFTTAQPFLIPHLIEMLNEDMIMLSKRYSLEPGTNNIRSLYVFPWTGLGEHPACIGDMPIISLLSSFTSQAVRPCLHVVGYRLMALRLAGHISSEVHNLICIELGDPSLFPILRRFHLDAGVAVRTYIHILHRPPPQPRSPFLMLLLLICLLGLGLALFVAMMLM